jgi:succinyl-CoA synthetase beta subunit
VNALYKAYDSIDASLFEINPVLKTSDDKIIAVDAKVNLDDNGLFRHPPILLSCERTGRRSYGTGGQQHELNY